MTRLSADSSLPLPPSGRPEVRDIIEWRCRTTGWQRVRPRVPRGPSLTWTRCRWLQLQRRCQQSVNVAQQPWCRPRSPGPSPLSYRCLQDAGASLSAGEHNESLTNRMNLRPGVASKLALSVPGSAGAAGLEPSMGSGVIQLDLDTPDFFFLCRAFWMEPISNGRLASWWKTLRFRMIAYTRLQLPVGGGGQELTAGT